MQTNPVTLVTIVAEGVLREQLLTDLERLGARGYTISEVQGEGTRGISGQFFTTANVRIETLVAPDVANLILAHLHETYFHDYSMIAYTSEVRVIRAEKYL